MAGVGEYVRCAKRKKKNKSSYRRDVWKRNLPGVVCVPHRARMHKQCRLLRYTSGSIGVEGQRVAMEIEKAGTCTSY